MQKIIGLVFILSIFGCASYIPVQLVGGERHKDNATMETCTHYIFTFPYLRHQTTIAGALETFDVKESEIYSIERSVWPYLPFLYGQHCLNINMNSTFDVVAYAKKQELGLQQQVITRKKQEAAWKKAQEIKDRADEAKAPGTITGNVDNDFESCNLLEGLARRNCRKKVYDFYDKKEKNK
jgi:hypothetical protein